MPSRRFGSIDKPKRPENVPISAPCDLAGAVHRKTRDSKGNYIFNSRTAAGHIERSKVIAMHLTPARFYENIRASKRARQSGNSDKPKAIT